MYESLDNCTPFPFVNAHQFKANYRQNTYLLNEEKYNTSVCFDKQAEVNRISPT